MPQAAYGVYVDWNNDGDFSDSDEDISADVQEIKISRGKDSQLGRAQAGECELKLKDLTGKYSPENASSPLYGLLLPGRPVKVTMTYGGTVALFNGYLKKIMPNPHWDRRYTYIYCLDAMDRLARDIFSTKVFTGICQEYTLSDDSVVIADDDWAFQTFTPAESHILIGLGLKLYKSGGGGTTVTVGVRATSNGEPTGADLVSATIPWADITTNSSGLWYNTQLEALEVTKGVTYAIVLRVSDSSPYNLRWRIHNSGSYDGGIAGTSSDGGSTWTKHAAADFAFKEFCLPGVMEE